MGSAVYGLDMLAEHCCELPPCDETPRLRLRTFAPGVNGSRLVVTLKWWGRSSSEAGQSGELMSPTSDLYGLLELPLMLIGGRARSVRTEALDFG